jgi:hypothetical protein
MPKNGNLKIISDGHITFTNYGNKSISISDEPFLSLNAGRYIIRSKVYWPVNE